MRQQSLYRLRDWLFNLLMDYFVNSDWVIVIEDFKKSKKRSRRNYMGLTDYQEKIIYLDKDSGTPRVLIHELCHFGFETVLEGMSQVLPRKDLKKVRGRRRTDKEFEWRELRTEEFEKYFYPSLSKRQIKMLRGFTDEAQARYKNEG